MASNKISSNNLTPLATNTKPPSSEGHRIRTKRKTDKKLPENYEAESQVKHLAKWATDKLTTAFSESLKKLSLKPVYDWSAEHNIKPSTLNKLLILHGLIKTAAKSESRLIPINKRKISDPCFQHFIQDAEKQVIKNNAPILALLKEKKRKQKIISSNKKYKRKFGRNNARDAIHVTIEPVEQNIFESVDRKANEASGIDSVKADKSIGLADVQQFIDKDN
ncbi:MAG: hypothetical protein PUP46_06110 [Endozoicomonas sp. (ex Botrylloides leachii)]|nr:hypothetical protein [Endozoicomonas sp. (ex Botrylloides leachii)]